MKISRFAIPAVMLAVTVGLYLLFRSAIAAAGVPAEAPAIREVPPPTGWSLGDVIVIISVAVAGLFAAAIAFVALVAKVLHLIAAHTATTRDDGWAEHADKVLAEIVSLRTAVFSVLPEPPAARPAASVVNVAPSSPPGSGTAALLALLLLGGLATSQLSCATLRPAAATGVVAGLDCEAAHFDAQTLADARAFAEAKVQRWISGTGAQPDATAIKADLAPIKSDLGRCALTAALAAATAIVARPAASENATLAARSSGDLRAMFSAAARASGWAPVKLADGTVL